MLPYGNHFRFENEKFYLILILLQKMNYVALYTSSINIPFAYSEESEKLFKYIKNKIVQNQKQMYSIFGKCNVKHGIKF